ncbi:MAG: amino acid ABC transporter permease [Rubripirellula sp.]|nr:amino acid ABC transporter permease [Rubripirellula sp.]
MLNWVGPLTLTAELMGVSVSIAAILGIIGAWAGSVLQSGGKLCRSIALMLVGGLLFAVGLPLVLHAGAWESTAGKFGWLMLTQTGARAEGTSQYGIFAGLVAAGWIHGLYGAAIVTLTTWHGVRRTPSAMIQQSRLDLPPMAAWWRVRLPMAAPWFLLGLLITALLAASEMTVVDLYGFRTIADEFYLFYATDPSLLAVFVACAMPLAISAWLVGWMLASRRQTIATQSDQGYTADEAETYPPFANALAGMVGLGLVSLIVGVPMIGLLIKLGHEVVVVDGTVEASWSWGESASRLFSAPRDFASEYQWTAIIAMLAGSCSLLIASPLAVLGRTKARWEPWLDGVSVIAFVIPGPIVGMVVVWIFQRSVPGFGYLYQQTLVPTLIAVLVRAVPVSYWILRSSFRGISDSILDTSRLDASPLRRFFAIHRPLLARGWFAAALAGALVASGDLPATLPVIPPGVTTVGTRLFGLLHSGARYQEAALSIWYVLVVVVISSLFVRLTLASKLRSS